MITIPLILFLTLCFAALAFLVLLIIAINQWDKCLKGWRKAADLLRERDRRECLKGYQ